ncbi:hypothetical protein BU24DRAFT_452527 [Aaosphaeria arxii CBS 175.79]|uniref:Fork-head domain-containing protein n=1 Tax=Aaosphaeria arxii CBS 175.79 TaxID=1450172 RepID=A0A6A5XLJ8_9PLEO|nr:uncharacterized protein BU24DRAFT_452527 [Aaosphaeria arxii CBS 175.79]KAF2013687.1 hypothetical protein BU24DRAFT_452527 [Aaosphaeria arxii CBS 175.79]
MAGPFQPDCDRRSHDAIQPKISSSNLHTQTTKIKGTMYPTELSMKAPQAYSGACDNVYPKSSTGPNNQTSKITVNQGAQGWESVHRGISPPPIKRTFSTTSDCDRTDRTAKEHTLQCLPGNQREDALFQQASMGGSAGASRSLMISSDHRPPTASRSPENRHNIQTNVVTGANRAKALVEDSNSKLISRRSSGNAHKCAQCQKSTGTSYDPFIKCPTCRRRFHEGCRKPNLRTPAEKALWQCYVCVKKAHRLPAPSRASPNSAADRARPFPSTLGSAADYSTHERPHHYIGNSTPMTPNKKVRGMTTMQNESNVLKPLGGFDLDKMVDESTLVDNTVSAEQADMTGLGHGTLEIPNTPTQRSSQILSQALIPGHLLLANGSNITGSISGGKSPGTSTAPRGLSLQGDSTDSPSMMLCPVCNLRNILKQKGTLALMCHRCKSRKLNSSQPDSVPIIPETPDCDSEAPKLPTSTTVNVICNQPTSTKYSYKKLIGLALLASKAPALTAAEIRDSIATRFPDTYRKGVDEPKTWERSVQATLSQSNDFMKVAVPGERTSQWKFASADIRDAYMKHLPEFAIANCNPAGSTSLSAPGKSPQECNRESQSYTESTNKSSQHYSKSRRQDQVQFKDRTHIRSNEEAVQALHSIGSLLGRIPHTDQIHDNLRRLDQVMSFLKQGQQIPTEPSQIPVDTRSEVEEAFSDSSEEMTREDINRKIAETRTRPSRKARFDKHLRRNHHPCVKTGDKVSRFPFTGTVRQAQHSGYGRPSNHRTLEGNSAIPSGSAFMLPESQLVVRGGSRVEFIQPGSYDKP